MCDPTVERILQHSPHAIVLVDRDGLVQHANGRAEPLLNSPTSDLLGQPLARFLVEHDRGRLQKRIQLATTAKDGVDDLDVHLDRPEDGLFAVSFIPLAQGRSSRRRRPAGAPRSSCGFPRRGGTDPLTS